MIPPDGARVDVEDRDGDLRVLTLHNPSRRNALDRALLSAIAEALDPAKTAHVRAILIRGAHGAFSSGYDLGQLSPADDGDALPDDHVGELLDSVARHPAPSVALVEGPAFGAGCELAVTCDFRVGGPAAVFCMPPARLGIVYAPEGIAKVARIVGWQRAKRMFLTGMQVDAGTAFRWGLLDEYVEDAAPGAAEAKALALCRALADGAPLAVQGMRRAIAMLSRTALSAEDDAGLRALRRDAYRSADLQEGRAAFLEKRKPRFTGR
ncbi:MAG: enoyl-CoA hydratase/isomerase family protein [Myxococcaceae bacterium]|nr:enoyl-CoA hydratase/isomerase family protein [Myxococcaceae bacterium]